MFPSSSIVRRSPITVSRSVPIFSITLGNASTVSHSYNGGPNLAAVSVIANTILSIVSVSSVWNFSNSGATLGIKTVFTQLISAVPNPSPCFSSPGTISLSPYPIIFSRKLPSDSIALGTASPIQSTSSVDHCKSAMVQSGKFSPNHPTAALYHSLNFVLVGSMADTIKPHIALPHALKAVIHVGKFAVSQPLSALYHSPNFVFAGSMLLTIQETRALPHSPNFVIQLGKLLVTYVNIAPNASEIASDNEVEPSINPPNFDDITSMTLCTTSRIPLKLVSHNARILETAKTSAPNRRITGAAAITIEPNAGIRMEAITIPTAPNTSCNVTNFDIESMMGLTKFDNVF